MADDASSGSGDWVYQQGSARPQAEARFAVDDHGLLFGLGFFETFRTSGGRPHLWAAHRRRLLQACARAGVEPAPTYLVKDEARLSATIKTLLAQRGLTDAVFRYTVSAGTPADVPGGAAYPNPVELLALRPMPAAAPTEGVALRLLDLARDNGEWLPRPKSLNYANALMGGLELQRRGAAAHDEGLFLTREGRHVVEAVRHNLAWLRDGRWFYPDPALGAVPGIGLEWLLEGGIAAEPIRASLDDFVRAEAVVVLNSVRGATPVRELWNTADRVKLGSWASWSHPAVIALRERWAEALRDTARRTG